MQMASISRFAPLIPFPAFNEPVLTCVESLDRIIKYGPRSISDIVTTLPERDINVLSHNPLSEYATVKRQRIQ